MRKRNETEFVYGNGDDNDGDEKVDDDPTDTVDITAEVKAENDNSSPKHLPPNDFDTNLHDNDHKCNPLKNIKMLEKLEKRGRPKGAEVTVVILMTKFCRSQNFHHLKKTVQLLNARQKN